MGPFPWLRVAWHPLELPDPCPGRLSRVPRLRPSDQHCDKAPSPSPAPQLSRNAMCTALVRNTTPTLDSRPHAFQSRPGGAAVPAHCGLFHLFACT